MKSGADNFDDIISKIFNNQNTCFTRFLTKRNKNYTHLDPDFN